MALRTAFATKPRAPVPVLRTATPSSSQPQQVGSGPVAAPAPVAPTLGAAPAPAAPGAGASPWAGDPILAQINAINAANTASAEAAALAARQRALINFGFDQNLNYGDASTAEAAKQNPFSVLQNLLHTHTQTVHNLNENLNKQNLFYSGFRGQQLGEENRNYLGNQYGANQTLQGQLSGISQNLLGSQQSATQNLSSGTEGAYNRWLTNQLTYGGTGTAAPATSAGAQGPLRSALPWSPTRGNARTRLLRGR